MVSCHIQAHPHKEEPNYYFRKVFIQVSIALCSRGRLEGVTSQHKGVIHDSIR